MPDKRRWPGSRRPSSIDIQPGRYAPDEDLIGKVFGASSLGTPLGELEELLWTMPLEHLAWFASGDDSTGVGQAAKRALEVRVAFDSAEGIRETNKRLVRATWALVLVTALLALATVLISVCATFQN